MFYYKKMFPFLVFEIAKFFLFIYLLFNPTTFFVKDVVNVNVKF
jgi:hypothetical protein